MDYSKDGSHSFSNHGALSSPIGLFNSDGEIFKPLKEEYHSIWKIFNGVDEFLVGTLSIVRKRERYSCSYIFGQRCWWCIYGRDHSQATFTTIMLEAE